MSIGQPDVLLIDDDPHTCAIFEILMEHHQYPFFIVDNAYSALDYLRQHSPDIIIIDLFLPGMDGFQALSLIRNEFDESNYRILATTAYYTKDTWHDVTSRGFDGYIPKPFVPNTFLSYLSTPVDEASAAHSTGPSPSRA